MGLNEEQEEKTQVYVSDRRLSVLYKMNMELIGIIHKKFNEYTELMMLDDSFDDNLTKSRDVYVRGGHLDIDNDVDVRVKNEVNVDISAINGYHDVFYNDYRGATKYYRIPVNSRN